MTQLTYDSTWEGFLTGVFECFTVPDALLSPSREAQTLLFGSREVEADPEKYGRVLRGVRTKLGAEALHTLESAWLTHLPGIEDDLVHYLRKSFAAGRDLYDDRNDPCIQHVAAAAARAGREAQRLMGFVRFRPAGRLMISDIHPTADLLPLLAPHFADRFPGQPFAIRDHTHMRALLFDGSRWMIADFQRFDEDAVQTGDAFEALWQAYYRNMTIEARKNPNLRRQMMPKKYWNDLPEMRGLL